MKDASGLFDFVMAMVPDWVGVGDAQEEGRVKWMDGLHGYPNAGGHGYLNAMRLSWSLRVVFRGMV